MQPCRYCELSTHRKDLWVQCKNTLSMKYHSDIMYRWISTCTEFEPRLEALIRLRLDAPNCFSSPPRLGNGSNSEWLEDSIERPVGENLMRFAQSGSVSTQSWLIHRQDRNERNSEEKHKMSTMLMRVSASETDDCYSNCNQGMCTRTLT